MARKTAIHAAAAVKQINTITVANTWATSDIAVCTMNGKALTVTIGADTSTTQVAQAIRDAWNATSRLDSEGTTDATSNFGGQEFGDFAEVTASIDPDAPSVVILTANTAGVPFTVVVTETTAGSGTATGATAQAATGPWHFDNAKNFDTGTVLANDDVLVLINQSGQNVGFKYGLPNGSIEFTIEHWHSYTGQIGLPAINATNGAKPYPEYRQRYMRLDDSGSGTDIAHRFGLGKDGTGSPLMNIKHSTVKCSPIVYNTGTPQIPGTKALNLCCTANTSTLNVMGGSVDFSSQDGSTCAFQYVQQTGGDSRGYSGLHSSGATLQVMGGTTVVGGTAINYINTYGGSTRLENLTGSNGDVVVRKGTLEIASAGVFGTVLVDAAGVLDLRQAPGAVEIDQLQLQAGSQLLDPFIRRDIQTSMTIYFEVSDSLQLGNSNSTPLVITP